MEITLTIQGATPAEVREALRELYAQGTPGEPMEAQPIDIKPEDIQLDISHEVKKRHIRPHKKHTYNQEEDDFIRTLDNNGLDYSSIKMAFNKRFSTDLTNGAIYRRVLRLRES